jgi:hypothetical protein
MHRAMMRLGTPIARSLRGTGRPTLWAPADALRAQILGTDDAES